MKFLDRVKAGARRVAGACAVAAAGLVSAPVMAAVDLTAVEGLETDLQSMTPVFTGVAVAFAITGWVVARII